MSNQGDGQGPPEQDGHDQQQGRHRQQSQDEPNEQQSQGNSAGQPSGGQPLPGASGGQRLPRHTGGQPVPGNTGGQPNQPPTDNNGQWPGPPQGQPGNTGGQPGNTGGQQGQWSGGQQPWSGGQQPWSGSSQQPWAAGGQEPQPPSWSTGETGPNVGPTMNNPQNAYYDRFSAASGEGVVIPKNDGGGGNRGKVLIGVAAALVVVIAAIAVYAFTRDSGSPAEAGGSTSSSLPPVTATTWVNPTLAAGARALKPGWQAQTAQGAPGAFDVPKNKDWKLESSSYNIGYANPKSGRSMVLAWAPARYKVGYCSAKKTAEASWIGLMNVGKRDVTDAGPNVAQQYADAISMKSDGSKVKQGKMSAPKSIKVEQGTVPAVEYTITTPVGDPDDCDKGKTYEVRTVTFAAGGKTYQLVSIRVLGTSSTLPTDQLEEIFTTFRPAG